MQGEPMADYSQLVDDVKKCYDVRVRKWRRSMSGCAWRVYYHDGRVINWIEAPVPRTPISLAIFLHEVGHHVIGFDRYKKRCEEEYHVWVWAIRKMRELGRRAGRARASGACRCRCSMRSTRRCAAGSRRCRSSSSSSCRKRRDALPVAWASRPMLSSSERHGRDGHAT